MGIIPFTFLALVVSHPAINLILNTVSKVITVYIITPSIIFVLVALPLATDILALAYLDMATTASTRGFTRLLCSLDLLFITMERTLWSSVILCIKIERSS